MSEKLEHALAFHCAPALAGIKAANLVCLSGSEYPDLAEEVAAYDRAFRARGVRFRILCRCHGRNMVLVYRPALLERALGRPQAEKILSESGYGDAKTLSERLERLSRRLRESGGEFPHEIGLFLDYPPEDVEGFRRCGGRGCKLCGYWKVYGDAEAARIRFHRYDRCRAALCRRVDAGVPLMRIFRAA